MVKLVSDEAGRKTEKRVGGATAITWHEGLANSDGQKWKAGSLAALPVLGRD